MSQEVDFAILVSIAEPVLKAGKSVAEETGFVAFRSDDAASFFQRADELRGDEPVPVLFYASEKQQMEGESLKTSWIGSYIGQTEPVDGKHPEGDAHLPEGAETDAPGDDEDEEAMSPVYWHIRDLRELPEKEHVAIASMESHAQRGIYRRNTEPRRPALVALPRGMR